MAWIGMLGAPGCLRKDLELDWALVCAVLWVVVDGCIWGWKGWMVRTLEFEQEHSHLHQWRS